MALEELKVSIFIFWHPKDRAGTLVEVLTFGLTNTCIHKDYVTKVFYKT